MTRIDAETWNNSLVSQKSRSHTAPENQGRTTSKLIQLCDSEMQENHGSLESMRNKDSDWYVSEMWSRLPQSAHHGHLHVIHSCRGPLKRHSTSAVSCILTRIKDSKLSWQNSHCSGPLKTRIKHSTSAESCIPTRIKCRIPQCRGPLETRIKHTTAAISCVLTRTKDSDKSSRDNLTVPRPAKNSDKALDFSCNLHTH